MLLTSLRIAIKALKAHKLRTALTMLGMTIGVAAVITMFALGSGAQQTVSDDIQSSGTTLINVRAGNYTRGGEESNIGSGLGAANTLSTGDAAEIAKIDGVRYIAPGVKMKGWVYAGESKAYASVHGTDSTFPSIHTVGMASGKFFKAGAVASAEPVAVLGPGLSDRLFPDGNAVGQTVQIRGTAFRVAGVLSTSDDEQSESAYLPYPVLQKLLGITHLHLIAVCAKQAGETTRIAAELQVLLRKRHRLDTADALDRVKRTGLGGDQMPHTGMGLATPDDFTIKTQAAEALTKGLYTSVAAFVLANMPKVDQVNMQEMAGTLNRAGSTMTAMLAATATISLIVGGIGIMNIMLVSVTERTREIGIRRAVGARSAHVLMQFLVEAMTLGLFGGVIGILLGFLAAFSVTQLLEWPASVSFSAIALSVGISASVGVFFGFYPARRASRLHPIDALRHE
ncbi:MAG: putative transport system permease protein [Bryobacterales bacterium]|jgi:ABC-type antimicrobial peptide transport system permease subunit|nr:putative transport system permease protein [Bryobacterales bacterium]